ncbi:MAG: hypothetical protein JNK75_01220 [Betaproteobacteria bacterium]|nr:hypothetical protein [Betaproteobacteria bacterium]
MKYLELHQVEYMVLGGYAVAFHGYPRATVDFDVWVRASKENAARVFHALAEFGFPLEGISDATLAAPGTGVRMGSPPFRLEVINFATGLEFENAIKNSMRVKLEDVETNMISLEDLKTNKRATGRNKDLADLDHLPGGYLEQRAKRNNKPD